MARRLPSGRWYALAGLLAALGIGAVAWGVSGLFGFEHEVAAFQRVDVPGQAVVTLEPGKYVVYYEAVDAGSVPPLEVFVEPAGDVAAIDLRRPSGSMTYETGGYQGEAVWEFAVDEPGTHSVEVLSDTDLGQLAIGTSMVGGLLAIVFGMLGGVGALFLAIIVVVVTAVRRSRARRRTQPMPYGNGYSYGFGDPR